MIVQEENHKKMMLGPEERAESTAAIAAFMGDQSYGTITEKVRCKHCSKYNDDKSTCYEIIGYPSN